MKCFCASVCVLLSFGFVCGQSPCVTPKGDNGDCRSMLECPQLRTILNRPSLAPDEAALLRQSVCGYTDNIPKVCCPTTKEPPPLIKTCVTPEGSQGECVSVFDCAHVVKRLQSATVTAEDKAYVNSIRCQATKGGFSVCCGIPNPPSTRSTEPSTAPPDSPSTGGSAPSDPHAECGKDASSGSKLLGVGGHATLIDEYPWLAIVERRNRENRSSLVCGGALISARYVLTAAHCVSGVAGPPSTVRLGEYDTSHPGRDCVLEVGGEDCSDEPVVIPIELVVPHHGYDARSKRHDIALLRLSQHAPYTDFIRPICLPTTDVAEFRGGEWLVMAGWGANETHSTSSVKLAVDLPYKSIEECQLAYNGPRRRVNLWRGQLCAGGEPGRDSCKGDSGGPLMYFSSRQVFEVIGIVSFGATTCGLEHVPGVYTKVFEYLAWIRNNMEP